MLHHFESGDPCPSTRDTRTPEGLKICKECGACPPVMVVMQRKATKDQEALENLSVARV